MATNTTELSSAVCHKSHVIAAICAIMAAVALALAFTGCMRGSSTPASPNDTAAPNESAQPGAAPAAPGSSSQLSRLAVGDIFAFGTYEQDNDPGTTAEPIEWRVLSRDGNRVLVIAVAGLDCRQFNANAKQGNDWETSDLKAWLEGTFMAAAFSAEERASIDEITCLSLAEASKLFESKDDRICQPTPYARAQGRVHALDWPSGAEGTNWGCNWWLLTPGSTGGTVIYVEVDGAISGFGEGVDSDIIAVRPALWLLV